MFYEIYNMGLQLSLELVGHRTCSAGTPTSRMHETARARAAELGLLWHQRSDARCSEKAALTELLKGRTVYECGTDPTTLKSFKANLVSRPLTASDAPFLDSVVSPEASIYLSDFDQRMFHPTQFWSQLIHDSGITPYTDPC